jgi:hypothetical protein
MDSDSVSSRVEFDPSGTGSIGVIELRCELEAMAYNFADLEACFGPESAYARFVLSQQRDALQAELSRCERLHAAGHSVPNPNDQRYQQWLELAREVRKHADIVQVFAEAGISLSRAGWNSSREAEEWAGGCFVCGGKDRFRVWRGCRAGYWCRQCGVHGDVLNAVRNLVPGCSAFFAAVRYLAGQLGMPIQEREARRRSDAATEGGASCGRSFMGHRSGVSATDSGKTGFLHRPVGPCGSAQPSVKC